MPQPTAMTPQCRMLCRPLLLAATTVAAVLAAGCRSERVDPFSPRALGDPQRKASEGQSTDTLRPLATDYPVLAPTNRRAPTIPELTTRPSPEGGMIVTGTEPRRAFSLEDVVRRTVSNNLDIKATGYSPAIESARIIEAEARFDPTFFTQTSAEVSDRQTAGTTITNPRNIFQPIRVDEQQSTQYTLSSGLRQVLEGGGQVEARYQLRQTDANPSQTLIDPYREADVVFQLQQPLLRDFGGQVNRARIDIARNNARISMLDFRKQVEDSVLEVEQAYWQLVAAQRTEEIAARLLQRTEETADLIARRMGNDASVLQYAQAQADAESRRAALVRSRAQIRDLSDRIKRLMNDPEIPIGAATLVVADASPLEQPVRFQLDELIDTALQHRLELAQQQLRVNNAVITQGAAKNNLLPQLNFVGSVNPSGTQKSWGSANNAMLELTHVSYSAGLQLEVPIGNREARSIYRRTLLQMNQAMTQYQSLVLQVTEDVLVRHRDVETRWKELQNARSARAYQERALRAIQSQEDTGEPLTPFFVRNKLDTQQRVAEAENQEVSALAAYNTALSQLEKAKGTLLKYNNITLDEKGMRRQIAR